MATRLRQIDLTVLIDKVLGVDFARIPVVGAACAFYRLGSEVSATGPVVIATATVVAVYDSGGLKVGDTVQKNVASANTATVAEVTSPTSIKLTITPTHSLSLSRGDYLVPTNDRPTIYDESSGVHAIASSPSPTTDANGQVGAYSTESMLTAIVSGGSPSLSATLKKNVPAGYDMPNHWVNVRDYGNNIQRAINSLPSGGTVFLPAGTYEIAASLTIPASDTRLLGESSSKTIIQPTADNPAFHLITFAGGLGGCSLEHIAFNGRATAAGSYDVLQIINPGSNAQFNTYINRCSFYNSQRYAMNIQGNFDLQVRDSVVFNAWGTGLFIDSVGSDNATHMQFDNFECNACDLAGADKPAVKIDHSYGARFINCRFESNRGGAGVVSANAIHAKNSFGLVIQGCHCELNVTVPAVTPPARPAQFYCFEDCRGVLFAGDTVEGPAGSSTYRPTYVAMLYGTAAFTYLDGQVNGIHTNLVHSDNNCNNFFIKYPHLGAQNTPGQVLDVTDNTKKRSVRIRNATLGLCRFDDAADFTARGAQDEGGLYYLLSDDKSYTKTTAGSSAHY